VHRRRLLLASAVSALAISARREIATAQYTDEDVAMIQELATYLGALDLVVGLIGWIMQASESATSQAAVNLSNEEWRVDVLSPTAVAQATLDQFQLLTPPEIFKESHEHTLAILRLLVKAGEHIRSAAFTGDLDGFGVAAEYLDWANEEMRLAVASLPKVPE
jgi:hypothetical protein